MTDREWVTYESYWNELNLVQSATSYFSTVILHFLIFSYCVVSRGLNWYKPKIPHYFQNTGSEFLLPTTLKQQILHIFPMSLLLIFSVILLLKTAVE